MSDPKQLNITVFSFSTDDEHGTTTGVFANKDDQQKCAYDWCFDRVDVEEVLESLGEDPNHEDPSLVIEEHIPERRWDRLYEKVNDSEATCATDQHSLTLNVPMVQAGDIANLEAMRDVIRDDEYITDAGFEALERAIATLKALKEIHNAG